MLTPSPENVDTHRMRFVKRLTKIAVMKTKGVRWPIGKEWVSDIGPISV